MKYQFKSGEVVHTMSAEPSVVLVELFPDEHVAVTDTHKDGVLTLAARFKTLAIELENLAGTL